MNINHILSVEKLRDGGSLIVSFQSDDSCEYWVMFPIANFGENDPVFRSPVLINRTTGIEVDLSLNSAHAWLKRLEPFVSNDEDRNLFSRIVSIASENT